MIILPAAICVDRAMRSKPDAPHRGPDLPQLLVEAALALVIFPAFLLVSILVGVVMAADWLVRRAGAIRRTGQREAADWGEPARPGPWIRAATGLPIPPGRPAPRLTRSRRSGRSRLGRRTA